MSADPKPPPTLLLLAAAALSLEACRGPEEKPEESSLRELQELLETSESSGEALQGTREIDPADIYDEEDFFAEMEARYADQPEEEPEPEGPTLGVGSEEDEADIYEGEPPRNLFVEFGAQILQYEDGRIVKPFFFPTGLAATVHSFLLDYAPFSIHVPDGSTPQPLNSVRLDLREKWNQETWTDPRQANLTAGTAIPLGDAIFVTAVPDLILEVEDLINLFSADTPQIEIEAKIVEVSTSDSLDIGIRPIGDGSTPIFGLPQHTFLRTVDFSLPNSVTGTEALFTVSSVHDGLAFNAVLEAVSELENVQIISRPKVAVREGARAEIVNTTQVPYLAISSLKADGTYAAGIAYLDIGVQMYVVPRVVGTDTIILNIDIEASQQTGSSVTFSSGVGSQQVQISTPEVSQRKARTVVRLAPGQAVILGGLISERSVERERKIPILGDIPLLGSLFKSKLKQKDQTNVLFFIRPRILQGSDLNKPFE